MSHRGGADRLHGSGDVREVQAHDCIRGACFHAMVSREEID
ncbi:MAG: hypothetical protein ACRDFA_09050 [bacterium]